MPDFRFVCAEPTFQPSSGYASRIPIEIWSQYEELIRRLHACATTRDDILRTLIQDYDFHPSYVSLFRLYSIEHLTLQESDSYAIRWQDGA